MSISWCIQQVTVASCGTSLFGTKPPLIFHYKGSFSISIHMSGKYVPSRQQIAAIGLSPPRDPMLIQSLSCHLLTRWLSIGNGLWASEHSGGQWWEWSADFTTACRSAPWVNSHVQSQVKDGYKATVVQWTPLAFSFAVPPVNQAMFLNLGPL
jgi:hypothetical protein